MDRFEKASRPDKLRQGPTHACPDCGEWFEVEQASRGVWMVSNCDNEGSLAVQVWTEAAHAPVCPFDAATLEDFLISEF